MMMTENERLRFPLSEYQRRYDLVVSEIRQRRLDALLVRNLENICYLTGYEDAANIMYHCLILSSEEPVLILRRYEETNMPEFSWLTRSVTFEDHEHPVQVLCHTLEKMGLADKRLGVEIGLSKSGVYFWAAEFEMMKSELLRATMVPAADIIATARLVKSDLEIDALRQASRISEKATEAGVRTAQVGRSENEVAAEVYRTAISEGSEYVSMTPFVLSGERTSLPHGTWRGRKLQAGDTVYFEIPANKFRYEAPTMRTICLGEPSPRLTKMAKAMNDALTTAMEVMRPGATGHDIDATVRSVIDKAGFGGPYYTHGTGYSLGISFPPAWGEMHTLALRQGATKALQQNMVFHVVPISVIYRQLGVGFSAVVRITDTGCEALSDYPRALVVK
jgi:Xaa-Pro dipeptidase